MTELDEIVKEFLIEGNEHLDRLDNDFVAIEQNPTDRGLLSSIFRSIHTIKGCAGLMGFGKLEKLTHTAESLLALLRDGKMLLTSEMTTSLLSTVDAVRKMLHSISETGADGQEEYQDLISVLAALQNNKPTPKAETKPEGSESAKPADTQNQPIQEKAACALPTPEEISVPAKNLASVGQMNTAAPIVSVSGAASEVHKETTNSAMTDTAIRVDVALLDRLMNLAGELVLARNQVLQFAAKDNDISFQDSVQNINHITTELREGIMKTRMQPIGNIWGKFPRIVRDLAKACGKQVALEMDGEKTELDKTLIEAIRDPLTHLIRNAVDHGVEAPDQRRVRGKNPEGRLLLRAYHEGGQVNIEICDDGGGIDAQKVFAKAVEKGLLSQEMKDKMDEREMLNLIFLPGFSTAEKVTNVSGRGVGMDVVKTNIEKIGGTIDIISKQGKGTTFRLKIPLTLAIIPALTVRSQKNCFAIPQLNVLELVRLGNDAQNGAIEMFQNVPVYRLRGKLLPIVNLNQVLGHQSSGLDVTAELNIVVMQADEKPFGLVVDDIIDNQEIVVKPLGQQFKNLDVYAGATIMGDGKIALILDVMNLAQKAKVVGKMRDRSAADSDEQEKTKEQHVELLLVRSKDDGRIVIPLSQVARLEEFLIKNIEWTGDQATIQYRDEIIPLINLSEVLPERRTELRHENTETKKKSDRVQAIVYSKNQRTIGIVVEKVLDIVDEDHQLQKTGMRPGIAGTMVIQDRMAEVLDIDAVIAMALPGFHAADAQSNSLWQGSAEIQTGEIV